VIGLDCGASVAVARPITPAVAAKATGASVIKGGVIEAGAIRTGAIEAGAIEAAGATRGRYSG
jgi:hypothetical protein